MSSLADSTANVDRMDSVSCIELALEGERLCKTGDFRAGIAFFDAALKCGQPELKTVSAVYSQLGNAWFYLGEYSKALHFHKLDLNIAIRTSDRLGEAKASGNVGNVLKMLENYDQAVQFCSRHLEIARELNDKVGEGRALYNLGNIYHTKAKNWAQVSNHQPGNFPEEIKSCLESALKYYLETMNLSLKVGDETALGRTYGNIGNTYYLMGDFRQAVHYHEKRLEIAQKQHDQAAERRAHLNLGNANIFLGEFHKAAEHYLRTLGFAEQMHDIIAEAQTCFSLGNTYTLSGDLERAHKYYLRHLEIAKERKDKIGESRAYWSLANTMQSLNRPDLALQYASKHMETSMEINDLTGQEQAAMSIAALRKILNDQASSNEKIRQIIVRPARNSMKQMELVSMGQDNKAKDDSNNTTSNQSRARSASVECISKSHEDFFDLVHKYQSKRMDDQRCAISVSLSNKENKQPNIALQKTTSHSTGSDGSGSSKNKQPKPSDDDNFFDLLVGMQERRMNDQRATLPQNHPHRQMNGYVSGQTQKNISVSNRPTAQRQFSLNVFNTLQPDEDFFEQIIKCQSNRLEDQRSNFPPINKKEPNGSENSERSIGRPESSFSTQSNSPIFAPTVPKEDFFDLIFAAQSKNRLDDQRSVLPPSNKK